MPPLGCINVHASLLPRYRGPAPIQWAVIDGEKETGVTTMMTDIGMDTGDILLFERTPIGAQETAGELYERLAAIGARVLMRTLDQLAAGTLVRTPQGRGRGHPLPHAQKGARQARLFAAGAARARPRARREPWPGAYAAIDAARRSRSGKRA